MKNDTIRFKRQPKIIGSYSIVGPKEGQGNFKDYFDYIMKNDLFGEKTFEKAERKMVETAIARTEPRTKQVSRRIITKFLSHIEILNYF